MTGFCVVVVAKFTSMRDVSDLLIITFKSPAVPLVETCVRWTIY